MRAEGFEPPTYRLEGGCYYPLSYARRWLFSDGLIVCQALHPHGPATQDAPYTSPLVSELEMRAGGRGHRTYPCEPRTRIRSCARP